VSIVRPTNYPSWLDGPTMDLGDSVYADWGSNTNGKRTHLIVTHTCGRQKTGWWSASIAFDVPENAETSRNKWQVVSWEPLTLSPSLQLNCGCPLGHGFIQNGRWVRA
jgi:hypothetical protein